MTNEEIIDIMEELYGAGLGNAPKDAAAAVRVWRDFFGGDDARVIGKAVGLHLERSKFWPTPADIKELKDKAAMIIELEQERANKALPAPPKAPIIQIKAFCSGSAICPAFKSEQCFGTKAEYDVCNI